MRSTGMEQLTQLAKPEWCVFEQQEEPWERFVLVLSRILTQLVSQYLFALVSSVLRLTRVIQWLEALRLDFLTPLSSLDSSQLALTNLDQRDKAVVSEFSLCSGKCGVLC